MKTVTFKRFLAEEKKTPIDHGILDHLDPGLSHVSENRDGTSFMSIAVKQSSRNWGGVSRSWASVFVNKKGQPKLTGFTSAPRDNSRWTEAYHSAMRYGSPSGDTFTGKRIHNPFKPPVQGVDMNQTYTFHHDTGDIYHTGVKNPGHSPNSSANLNAEAAEGDLIDKERGKKRTDFTVGSDFNISFKTTSHLSPFDHSHFKQAQQLTKRLQELEPGVPFRISYAHEVQHWKKSPYSENEFKRGGPSNAVHSVSIDKFSEAATHADLKKDYSKKVDWQLDSPKDRAGARARGSR